MTHRAPVAKRVSAIADSAQSTRANPTEQADGSAGKLHAALDVVRPIGASSENEESACSIELDAETIASHANNARQLLVLLSHALRPIDVQPLDGSGRIVTYLQAPAAVIDDLVPAALRRLEAIVELERTRHAEVPASDPDQGDLIGLVAPELHELYRHAVRSVTRSDR